MLLTFLEDAGAVNLDNARIVFVFLVEAHFGDSSAMALVSI